MSKEIVEAVRGLAAEKNISHEKLMEALEDALLSAYKKTPGSAPYAKVEMDRASADVMAGELSRPPELEEQLLVEATTDQQPTVDPETGEMREPPEPEIDMEKLKEFEDQIEIEDVTPHDFGRIAAQTAKQVILQRIREAERDMMFEEYRDRVGELITGIVQQSDSRYTLVQLRERVEALLPKSEQVEGERYDHSQRIKAVIKDVSNSTKGPSIIVSRRDPELIKSLFELEVPEIADGLVEITGVAREPGYRSKIAVVSHVEGVDPVGACVGPRGSRVRMVVSELRGEKIDIIPYNDEPARFVAKALSPARVREVYLDDDGKEATVVVPDDQLALAIGKEGLNARLAARLSGWKVDIVSDAEFARQEADAAYTSGEEEFVGRCAANLANGKRCPNAALPGSHYCGVPAHQELEALEPEEQAAASATVVEEVESVEAEAPASEVEPEPAAAEEAEAPVAAEEPRAAAAPTPAVGRGASSVRWSATPSAEPCERQSESIPRCATSTLTPMANSGSSRPNRPIRPRQGAVGPHRKRRVVIDNQASRAGGGRPGAPASREPRADARTSGKTAAPAPTGPITVPSGVSVRDLSQALGIPVAQIIKIMMGLGDRK